MITIIRKQLNQTRLIVATCTKKLKILLIMKYDQLSQDITVD